MKKIMLVILVASSGAFSQTVRTVEVAPAPTEIVEDNKEIIVLDEKNARAVTRGSSEFNRMNKKYSITTQIFGYGPVSGQGIGLAYGQFLNRNSLVLFEWVKNNSTSQDLNRNETLTNFSVGAHFKKYTKDFYYWRMGADYRYADYDFTSTSSRGFKIDTVNVSIGAGVQWYWENFTAGVDAVGASIPLFTNSRKEDVGIFSKSSLDDAKKKYVTDTTWILGRAYVGVAF